MKKSFRESMRWLHTWSGLILGWLLFAIFVTGTSAYYRDEISLWMKPEFHSSKTSDQTMQIAVEKAIEAAKTSNKISVSLPGSRSNLIAMRVEKTPKQTQASQKARKGDKSKSGLLKRDSQEVKSKKAHSNKEHIQRDSSSKVSKHGDKQKRMQEGGKAQNKSNRHPKKKKRIPATYYDASTAELIKATTKTAGGDFLYRFHFELYNVPRFVGRWIVGIATMLMLVAIITGIIIHKRIFKDVFTFRAKNNPRGWMDAHILPAVAALPFLIMITYSGLILLTNIIFPYGMRAYYGDNFMAYRQDMMRAYNPSSIQKKQPLQKDKIEVIKENKNIQRIVVTNALRDTNRYASKSAKRIINTDAVRKIRENRSTDYKGITKEQLLAVIQKAEKIWPGNIGGFTLVKKANTTVVEVTPKDPSTLFSTKGAKESITFDGNNAKLVKQVIPPLTDSIVLKTSSAIGSLHRAKFADSTLRFIFFLSGILGIILSGTGLILWIEKRKKKNFLKKSFGFWLVEKLNLGTLMGIFIAIAVYFIANRVIIVEESARRALEINIFFLAWLASYIHAFLMDTPKAWREQLLFASLLFIFIPFINGVIVFESFMQIFNRDNIFIYFDLFCIFMAAVFIFIRAILIKKEKRKGEEECSREYI